MLIITHLSLMTIALGCFAAGIGMAMFGRRKKNWLGIHKRLNSAGVILLMAGGAAAFLNVVASEGLHLSGPHQWFGLTTVILCTLTWGLGFYFLKVRNQTTLRAAHRWLGRSAFVVMLSALVLGLRMIGIF